MGIARFKRHRLIDSRTDERQFRVERSRTVNFHPDAGLLPRLEGRSRPRVAQDVYLSARMHRNAVEVDAHLRGEALEHINFVYACPAVPPQPECRPDCVVPVGDADGELEAQEVHVRTEPHEALAARRLAC